MNIYDQCLHLSDVAWPQWLVLKEAVDPVFAFFSCIQAGEFRTVWTAHPGSVRELKMTSQYSLVRYLYCFVILGSPEHYSDLWVWRRTHVWRPPVVPSSIKSDGTRRSWITAELQVSHQESHTQWPLLHRRPRHMRRNRSGCSGDVFLNVPQSLNTEWGKKQQVYTKARLFREP